MHAMENRNRFQQYTKLVNYGLIEDEGTSGNEGGSSAND
jgi:hypothetical protein